MIDLAQDGVTHERALAALLFEGGRRDVRYELRTLRGGVHHRTLRHLEKELGCDYLSDVKFKGRFTVEDDPLVDWRSDLLQLVMVLRVDGKELRYPFPRLKPTRVSGIGRLTVEASDETALLAQSSVGERLLIPAGTPYTQFIESSLARAGFGDALIEQSDAAFATDREDWEPQTAWLTLLNGLLAEIGYRSLEAGHDGALRAVRYRPPEKSPCRIRYRAGRDSVILPGPEREIDSFCRPNRFIGYVSNPELEKPLRAEFLNDDPASPVSPARNGGYVLTAVRRFDRVASREALEANVRRWAGEAEAQYETVVLQTAVMPHHEVREIVAVECEGISGLFTEVGWTVGDAMTHRLRRIAYE